MVVAGGTGAEVTVAEEGMEDMQDMGAVVMAGVVTSRMKPSLRNQPQL